MRIFFVCTPSVHVELHRCECLPLEIAHVHNLILSAEDTVHIGCNVRLSRQARAYIGRDMEADILPHTACLVARPYSGIALRSCPTIERDNERTCVISIVRHDFTYICHTVKSERIACAYPCHVGFEHTHSGIAHFFHDVTLQQCAHAFLRMQVRLCPQSYLHPILTCIVAQFFQVLNISV